MKKIKSFFKKMLKRNAEIPKAPDELGPPSGRDLDTLVLSRAIQKISTMYPGAQS